MQGKDGGQLAGLLGNKTQMEREGNYGPVFADVTTVGDNVTLVRPCSRPAARCILRASFLLSLLHPPNEDDHEGGVGGRWRTPVRVCVFYSSPLPFSRTRTFYIQSVHARCES